jgi:hypothetical protein
MVRDSETVEETMTNEAGIIVMIKTVKMNGIAE